MAPILGSHSLLGRPTENSVVDGPPRAGQGPFQGLRPQNPAALVPQLQILTLLKVRDVWVGTGGEVKTQKGILILRDFSEDAFKQNKKLKFQVVLSHFSQAPPERRNNVWLCFLGDLKEQDPTQPCFSSSENSHSLRV